MLFNSICPLMQGNKAVTITVSQAEDGLMTVTILPVRSVSTEKVQEASILNRPFIMQGTADELDAGFFDKLTRFAGGYRKVADQLDETLAMMEEAEKALKAKGVKAATKVASKPEKLDLGADAPSASLPGESSTASKEATTKPTAGSDFDLGDLL